MQGEQTWMDASEFNQKFYLRMYVLWLQLDADHQQISFIEFCEMFTML